MATCKIGVSIAATLLLFGLAACGTPGPEDTTGTHPVQTQAGQRTITIVPDPAPEPPVDSGDETTP